MYDDDEIFENQGLEDVTPITNENDDIFGQSIDNQNVDLENDEGIFQTIPKNSNVINSLLASKGIEDPTKFQIENEEGELEEVDFYSLPEEEQLAILNDVDEPSISDSEIDLLNYLRESGLTLEQIIKQEQEKAIQDYILTNQTQYTIDDLSDEDLYKADLSQRFPELTEEDLDAEVEKELTNQTLFAKKASILREQYKELEKEEKEATLQEQSLQYQQEYDELVENLVDVAQNTTDFFNLDLEDEDKEEILEFLLEQDTNGQTAFTRLLSNPAELFKLAWFAKKGEEAFDVTHDYYKKQLDLSRKKVEPAKPKTVVKSKTNKINNDPYGIWE